MSDPWRSTPCREEPELWFPTRDKQQRGGRVADAITKCVRCPLRRPCARLALRTGAECGVWAGVDLGDTGGRRMSRDNSDALRAIADEVTT
jgi:WhiB family transcriptional regulator, redox-sensing transcriptional regulator